MIHEEGNVLSVMLVLVPTIFDAFILNKGNIFKTQITFLNLFMFMVILNILHIK